MSKILATLAILALTACAAAATAPAQAPAAFVDAINISCHGAVNPQEIYAGLPEASKQDPHLVDKFAKTCSTFLGLESN